MLKSVLIFLIFTSGNLFANQDLFIDDAIKTLAKRISFLQKEVNKIRALQAKNESSSDIGKVVVSSWVINGREKPSTEGEVLKYFRAGEVLKYDKAFKNNHWLMLSNGIFVAKSVVKVLDDADSENFPKIKSTTNFKN